MRKLVHERKAGSVFHGSTKEGMTSIKPSAKRNWAINDEQGRGFKNLDVNGMKSWKSLKEQSQMKLWYAMTQETHFSLWKIQ